MSEELPAGAVARAAGTWPGGMWESALTCREFTAVRGVGFEPVGQVFGAAVFAAGYASGYALFTCDISGQDFARLITAGWVPAGLAVGISIGSRHDDRGLAGQARRWSGNAEVAGWTELVNQSRHDARRRLEQDVRRLGGEGVVITGMQMRVRERDCPAAVGRRDHIAEVTLTGTAIARFSRAAPCPAGPALTVMPLGRQRRQGPDMAGTSRA